MSALRKKEIYLEWLPFQLLVESLEKDENTLSAPSNKQNRVLLLTVLSDNTPVAQISSLDTHFDRFLFSRLQLYFIKTPKLSDRKVDVFPFRPIFSVLVIRAILTSS